MRFLIVDCGARQNRVSIFFASVSARLLVGRPEIKDTATSKSLQLINLRDSAHERGKVFAVARGVIERVEPGVRRRFGQNNPA